MLYDFKSLEKTKFTSYQFKNGVNIWWDHLKRKQKVDEEHLEYMGGF